MSDFEREALERAREFIFRIMYTRIPETSLDYQSGVGVLGSIHTAQSAQPNSVLQSRNGDAQGGDGDAAAEVRLNKAGDAASLYWLRPFSSFDVGQKFYSDQPAQQVPESDLIDHIDLMSDEFKRIKALNPCDEISDLCDRALRVTKQNVPVVERAEKMERCISSLLWENAELKERLATPQPEAGEQWVRCEDQAPYFVGHYDAYSPSDGGRYPDAYWDGERWENEMDGFPIRGVTHYCAPVMPQPTKEQGE